MKAFPILAVFVSLMLMPGQFSLLKIMNHLRLNSDNSSLNQLSEDEIPAVAFCEMVENPQLYFDKTIRLTATIEMATEGIYLSDDRCKQSHDNRIGVGSLPDDDKQRELINRNISKIRSKEFGSRANVTITGILRNKSKRAFAWYRYQFDIIRFEEISQRIVLYEGSLEKGTIYRAAVRGDRETGLSLAIPLQMRNHVAVHIKWKNLKAFPALKQLRENLNERQIVFRVVSDRTKQMTENRWNRTLECKIISVE